MTAAAGWRVWLHNQPEPGARIIIARAPNRITDHEPVPMAGVRIARDLPPWLNIVGLWWRPA